MFKYVCIDIIDWFGSLILSLELLEKTKRVLCGTRLFAGRAC
jgi:hypothetical protein